MDVLIVTALPEEYEAVRSVHTGAAPGTSWAKPSGLASEGTVGRRFLTEDGKPLNVVVTLATDQGGRFAITAATRLFQERPLGKPSCLAMCGVCAGPRDKVQLGDVVIATHVWDFESGKLEATTDEAGQRSERLLHDSRTYGLHPEWEKNARLFQLTESPDWLSARPLPLTRQIDWFLIELAEGRQPQRDEVTQATHCAQFAEVVRRLRNEQVISDIPGGFRLTASGETRAARLLNGLPKRLLPPPKDFKVHVGVIVSGPHVVKDATIWSKLESSERNVRGLEREAFDIFATAREHDIEHGFVAKGVMDHADENKDDQFKQFAARASAECTLAFLRKHPPHKKKQPLIRLYLEVQPPEFDEGRRIFMKLVGAGLLAATAAAAVKYEGSVTDVDHRLAPRSSVSEEELRMLFRELFFTRQEKGFFLPAEDNPNVELDKSSLNHNPLERFTHTTLKAAQFFAGAVGFTHHRLLSVDKLIEITRAEGNLLTFGSPTSNRTARIAMNYGEIGDGKPGSRYYPSDALELKIQYALDGQAIRESGAASRLVRRVVKGVEKEIPNWGIWTQGGGIQCPADDGGRLLEDYLLISSLPNVFSRRSLDAGHRILNFGGTHREGTDAICRLAEQPDVIAQLRSGIAGLRSPGNLDPYWQALVLVDCSDPESAPKPVQVLNVLEVEVNQTHLRQIADRNVEALAHG